MLVFTFDTEVTRFRNGKQHKEAKEIKVELPEKVEEITLRAWADFAELRDKAPKFFADVTEADIDGGESVLAIPPGAWQSFIHHALQSVWTLAANRDEIKINDLLGIPTAADAEAEAADGLLALFATVMKPLREYKAKKRESFTHNGITYALYTNYLDQFGQNWVGKDMRTAEAVDALQFEEIFFSRDDDGSLYIKDGRYKNSLALTSMLSRKVLKGGELESPPIPLAERTQWLDERMKELEGVSMDVAMDIGFFLPNSKTAFQSTLLSVLRGRTQNRLQA